MPDLIAGRVYRATLIPSAYTEHAAWQSMDHYLTDWRRAETTLREQIEHLTRLRDERKEATENGRWPRRDMTEPHAEAAGTVDLVDALRGAVDAARERRKAAAGMRYRRPEADIQDGSEAAALNPECQQGKCGNCDGNALHPSGVIGACEHTCHG